MLILSLLIISIFVNSFWYDDVGLSTPLQVFLNNGIWAFPLDTKENSFVNHSTLITLGPALYYPALLFSKILGFSYLKIRFLIALFSIGFLYLIAKLAKLNLKKEASHFVILLLGFNIQFLTYGTQFLGEIPMLFWIFAGVLSFSKFIHTQKIYYALYLTLFWNLAILTKEYIALPLGLSLILSFIFIHNKNYRLFFLISGILLPLGSILWYFYEFGNLQNIQVYWQIKSAYQAEFISFHLEPLRFLLFKPIIFLGTFVLALKSFLRKDYLSIFLFNLQILLLVLFCIGQGFDRMGLILIPISALYLSEFLLYFYQNSTTLLKKSAFIFVFILLFVQNSIFIPLKLFSKPNFFEKEINSKLIFHKINYFYSCELVLIPFIDSNIDYSLPPMPPIEARISKGKIDISKYPYFISGPYSETEFNINPLDFNFVKLDSIGEYIIWKK